MVRHTYKMQGHRNNVISSPKNKDTTNSGHIVESVKDIIKTVIGEDSYLVSISNTARNFFEDFLKLSDGAQLMCTRLYGRMNTIFREHELVKLISPLSFSIDELQSSAILCKDLTVFHLDVLLSSLSHRELQLLASKYNIKNFRSLRSYELRKALNNIVKSGTSLSSFFGSSVQVEPQMRNEINKITGQLWFVNTSGLDSITAAIWLTGLGADSVSMSFNNDRSLEAQLKESLFTIARARQGDIAYPSYAINRHSIVYRTPEELQQYLSLMSQQLNLQKLIAKKDIPKAYEVFNTLTPEILDILKSSVHVRTDLPIFLRRFTPVYRALKIMSLGIDILERRRCYAESVHLLKLLLSYKSTGSGNRVRVCPFDDMGPCLVDRLLLRLLIDEGNHLQQPQSALDCVTRFLNFDGSLYMEKTFECLKAGGLLSLQNQLIKTIALLGKRNQCPIAVVTSLASNKYNEQENVGSFQDLQPSSPAGSLNALHLLPELKIVPQVNISASVNASPGEINANKPYYIWKEAEDPAADTLLLTVEQWTVKHYTQKLGYEFGLHCESQAYHIFFLLFFYDILYDSSPPDVYYSMYQVAPLDLTSGSFYESRRQAIDDRLNWIQTIKRTGSPTSEDVVHQLFKDRWTAHYGERCLWVDWDLFIDPETATELFWCLGPKLVHAVCRKLATDFRSWRSGLPDLIVWSPSKLCAKIIEVKGPGDKLSCQQMVWLDELIRAGADVEVCHVSAVHQKSITTVKSCKR